MIVSKTEHLLALVTALYNDPSRVLPLVQYRLRGSQGQFNPVDAWHHIDYTKYEYSYNEVHEYKTPLGDSFKVEFGLDGSKRIVGGVDDPVAEVKPNITTDGKDPEKVKRIWKNVKAKMKYRYHVSSIDTSRFSPAAYTLVSTGGLHRDRHYFVILRLNTSVAICRVTYDAIKKIINPYSIAIVNMLNHPEVFTIAADVPNARTQVIKDITWVIIRDENEPIEDLIRQELI